MTDRLTLQDWAGAKDSPQAILALVFTDIIDSTSLANRHGDNKWVQILMGHFSKARKYKDQYKGFEIKLLGDAYMVAFRTAAGALHFAFAFAGDTGHDDIKLRVGIHVGQVHIVDNDIYGRMVNYTARVQHALPESPGIILSDAAKEEAVAELGEENEFFQFDERETELRSFGKKIVWRAWIKPGEFFKRLGIEPTQERGKRPTRLRVYTPSTMSKAKT